MFRDFNLADVLYDNIWDKKKELFFARMKELGIDSSITSIESDPRFKFVRESDSKLAIYFTSGNNPLRIITFEDYVLPDLDKMRVDIGFRHY